MSTPGGWKQPALLFVVLLGRAAAFCPDSHASNCAFPRPRPAPARAGHPHCPALLPALHALPALPAPAWAGCASPPR